ncbi:hypothetical protein HDU98_010479 [Podochytrium sp. JEL0797]|nr:hypothetical protein HDU98_010479 [Podochytrium sp. JEL0797]
MRASFDTFPTEALDAIDTPGDASQFMVAELETAKASLPVEIAKPDDVVAITPLNGVPFLLIYVGMLMSVFMFALDSSILSPALAFIVMDLGHHEELLPWAGSAYMLCAAPVGILYVFEVGSLICALAQSMNVLIVGRAIAGIGGGGLVPLAYIVISDITSEKERGKFLAGAGAMLGMGTTLGPILGGISFCVGAMTFTGTYYIGYVISPMFNHLSSNFQRSLFFEFIFGYSAILAGAMSLPVCISFILVTIATGITFSKTGHYGTYFVISPFIWAAAVLWVSFFTKDSPLIQIVFALILMGIASGMVMQLRISAFQVAAPKHLTPIAIGISTSVCNIGANVGIAMMGTILNNLIVTKSAQFPELVEAVDTLQAQGYPASVSQYLLLSFLLKQAAMGDPLAAPLFLTAVDQLSEAFNQAFKIAYWSLLPFLALMLALVPFIWQRKGKGQVQKDEVAA